MASGVRRAHLRSPTWVPDRSPERPRVEHGAGYPSRGWRGRGLGVASLRLTPTVGTGSESGKTSEGVIPLAGVALWRFVRGPALPYAHGGYRIGVWQDE